jgi:hypothetical protein
MKTIKDILTENRDSVISSIKFCFKVYRADEIRTKMIEFLAYAEKYGNVERLENSKRVKSDLKDIVCHMAIEQKREEKRLFNLATYGIENPTIADMQAHAHQDEKFDFLKKEWIKY